jgi:hypothetical protein
MNLMEALSQVAGQPTLMAYAPPDRILGFSRTHFLVDFRTGREKFAHLRIDDFLRIDWELMTPEQLQANAAELERLMAEQASSGSPQAGR